jgi:hypothetical protein
MRRVVCLQAATVLWLVGGTQFFQLLNIHGVKGVRQTEISTTELLVPELNIFELEFDIQKLKSYK